MGLAQILCKVYTRDLQDDIYILEALIMTRYKLSADIYEGASKEVKSQTIRNMLMMCTGDTEYTYKLFDRKPEDRLRDYFETSSEKYDGVRKIPGTTFDYDSPGSFVLGNIVEIVSGKNLMDYLREKLFDKIGVSKEAYCLTCPGGHAWSDSGVICKGEDLKTKLNSRRIRDI